MANSSRALSAKRRGSRSRLLASTAIDFSSGSIVPYRGTATPSFTRASTQMFLDWENIWREAISGEVAFAGGRRVRNLLTFSEDFNNAAWTKTGGGTGSAPVITSNFSTNPVDGALTASRVVMNRGAGNTISDQSNITQTFSGMTSGTAAQSVYVKGVIGEQVAIRNVAGGGYYTHTFNGAWQRIAKNEVYFANNWEIANRGTITATNSITFEMYGAMLEDVTGQSVVAPSDYVPVGTGGPLFGANLVTNQNPASWESTGSMAFTSGVSDPFGGTDAYTLTATGASGFVAKTASLLAAGQSILNTMWIRRRTGVGSVQMYNGLDASSRTVVTTTGTWQKFNTGVSLQVTATGNANGILLATSGDAVDIYLAESNRCLFSGANVDGVRYFPTTNGNTVLANVVTAGVGVPFATPMEYQHEPAATNLILQSSTLDNASWVKANVTINATKEVGPRGTLTAQKVEETAISASHIVAQNLVKAASATNYTLSASLAPDERIWALLFITNIAETAYVGRFFNLQTGALGSAIQAGAYVASATATITPEANGFYRCTITATTDAAAETNARIYTSTDGAILSYLGVAGSGILCENVQLETGLQNTSPIGPTTTIAVTRAACVPQYTVPSISGPVTIVCTFTPRYRVSGSSGTAVNLRQNASNYHELYYNTASSVAFAEVTGGVTQANAAISAYVPVFNTSVKVAYTAQDNDVRASANGGTITADVSGTAPASLVTLALGNGFTASNASVNVRSVAIYTRSVNDNQLVKL